MKLSDIDLWDAKDGLDRLVREANATDRPFPGDRSVGALFAEQAAATPDAVAVVDGALHATYAELSADVDRLARFLAEHGVGPEVHVGVLLRRSYRLVVALLAVLKAGGVYVPLSPELPDVRLLALVRDAGCDVLVSEKSLVAVMNELHWNSPGVRVTLCLDSDDAIAELEPAGARMSLELWNYVAEHADDPIEANGWRSARTGERLSDATLDAYVRATAGKLSAYLGERSSMLEIGCGTGTTLRGLAPRVGSYVGIDPAAGVLRWADRARVEEGLDNVALFELGAFNLDELPPEHAGPFDAVVFNSVVQSFGGVNYLRAVLAEAIGRVGEQGAVYLGHVWDADRREEFLASLAAGHRPEHGGRPLSAADALFVPAAFFEDLPHHFPELAKVEVTPMAFHDEELTTYAYDVLLQVDRTRDLPVAAAPRSREQYDRRALQALPDAPFPDRHAPDAAAYVIQTSGSTGQPRSVEVVMHSLVNLLTWYRDTCRMQEGTRVAQVITAGFDASVKNFLAPLISGACVTLLPDAPYDPGAMLDFIEREAVEVLNPGVPSAVYPLVDLAAADGFRALGSLRCLALGGETPDLSRLRPWTSSPEFRARLLNVYGPTECTDIACFAELDADAPDGTAPPIGRPIGNVRAHVLDQQSRSREQPVGVVGELCLAGIGVARGYLGAPEPTRRKFVPDPFRPGGRLYRTGDLARRLPDGSLVVVGRTDQQVKLLGHRTELGEVEECLRRLAGVRDAVAVVRTTPATGELRLYGYIIPEDGAAPPDPLGLRAALGRVLPAAAVPADVVAVEEWPRNPHGKIDRRALPAPEQARRLASRPPQTATEAALLPLWREILDDVAVTVEDNFFAAGGHSLGAALLAIGIREVLRREVSIVDIYRAQTPAALARLIDQRPAVDSALTLLAAGDGAPVFCFPPIAGHAWTMAAFAQHLGFRTYGFDFPEDDDPVAAAADLILATAPNGPRFLVGYSAGGVFAWATALELRARGEEIPGLVVLDAAPPADRPRYTEDIVQAMVRDVLGDERLAAHIHQTGAERIAATVARYARWYSGADITGTCDSDVLFLGAARSDPSWADGWRSATGAEVTAQVAAGAHLDLLSGTNAVTNADPVRTWLAQRSSAAEPVRVIGPGIIDASL